MRVERSHRAREPGASQRRPRVGRVSAWSCVTGLASLVSAALRQDMWLGRSLAAWRAQPRPYARDELAALPKAPSWFSPADLAHLSDPRRGVPAASPYDLGEITELAEARNDGEWHFDLGGITMDHQATASAEARVAFLDSLVPNATHEPPWGLTLIGDASLGMLSIATEMILSGRASLGVQLASPDIPPGLWGNYAARDGRIEVHPVEAFTCRVTHPSPRRSERWGKELALHLERLRVLSSGAVSYAYVQTLPTGDEGTRRLDLGVVAARSTVVVHVPSIGSLPREVEPACANLVMGRDRRGPFALWLTARTMPRADVDLLRPRLAPSGAPSLLERARRLLAGDIEGILALGPTVERVAARSARLFGATRDPARVVLRDQVSFFALPASLRWYYDSAHSAAELAALYPAGTPFWRLSLEGARQGLPSAAELRAARLDMLDDMAVSNAVL